MNRINKRNVDMSEAPDNPLDVAVTQRDVSIMDMVAAAIKHNDCLLAYQPVVQTRGRRDTVFYEGFIRVLDATGRVIPAAQFMPHVEDLELGRELDCLALEHGLRALTRYENVRVSINMSARSIGYTRWTRVLNRFLKKDASLGERLTLEITETSAMSMPEIVVDFMAQMQDHGIAFALDDFGAGAIAIKHFKHFFFDAVKIDGQFIRGIDGNHDNQCLVRALVGTARQFDMLTIAEAVETRAEAEFLVETGLDCLQGYLFGAPTVRPPWIKSVQSKLRA